MYVIREVGNGRHEVTQLDIDNQVTSTHCVTSLKMCDCQDNRCTHKLECHHIGKVKDWVEKRKWQMNPSCDLESGAWCDSVWA